MNSNEQVSFRDYPIWLWYTGALVLAVAVVTGISAGSVWEFIGLSLIAFLIIGFASIPTVTLDHNLGSLSLHYRSLFRRSTKVFPLTEIYLVNVVEDSERERMYRIELTLHSGEVVPYGPFIL